MTRWVSRLVFCGCTLVLSVPVSSAGAFSPKEVYKKSSPGVVLVLGADKGGKGSGGTGSVIASDGKVITNAHVVINDQTGKPYSQLFVFLKPNKLSGDNKRDLVNRYKARVLKFSPAKALDLAVLQIEKPPANLSVIAFTDPKRVEIGDEVIAIGHPEGGGLWTLTTGTISTVIANYGRIQGKNVFQTEASVNRGNSGGPLLDSDGNMVGINTMIARKGAGGVTITDVNFSLKSSVAVNWLAGSAGMGLAYAPKNQKKVVVAVAPAVDRSVADAESSRTELSEPSEPSVPLAKSKKVTEPPASTIVVAEAPPKPRDIRKLQKSGREVGNKQGSEKVVAGERLDVRKAKPTYHTEKRPFSLEDLRKQQIQELESIMDEFRGMGAGKPSRGGKKETQKNKKKKSGWGLGLW